jgi:hypothetical protein
VARRKKSLLWPLRLLKLLRLLSPLLLTPLRLLLALLLRRLAPWLTPLPALLLLWLVPLRLLSKPLLRSKHAASHA